MKALTVFILVPMATVSCRMSTRDRQLSPNSLLAVQRASEASLARLSFVEFGIVELDISPNDAERINKRLSSEPSYKSYHLLLLLGNAHPDVVVENRIRASILSSALSELYYLNDWGYLDPTESFDGDVAQMLLDTGTEALEFLIPLLDDKRAAPLFGTQEATLSSVFQYRRCDFAYRYICLIIGLDPSFDADPIVRERDIDRLRVKHLWRDFP